MCKSSAAEDDAGEWCWKEILEAAWLNMNGRYVSSGGCALDQTKSRRARKSRHTRTRVLKWAD